MCWMKILMYAGEDDLSSTVVPRLMADRDLALLGECPCFQQIFTRRRSWYYSSFIFIH